MIIQTFPPQEAFKNLLDTHTVVPLCREILADKETPVSLLSKLHRPETPLFLLESVEGGKRWGRYSFIGLSPRLEIKIFSTRVEITQDHTTTTLDHRGDPLGYLKKVLESYKAAELPELPRFQGGLTGYFCHEMISFFDTGTRPLCHELPDHQPLAHLILADEMLIFDNVRHSLTALVLCFKEDSPDAQTLHARGLEKLTALVQGLEAPPAPPSTPDKDQKDFSLTPQLSPTDYCKGVARAKEAIFDGEIIQAVLSQSFVCHKAPDPVALYRAQRYINPSPYLFFMNLGETCLVGSSPETMVKLERGRATLRPIAGTRPRGKTQQEDRQLADALLKDEKERAEHLMLVDLGRNDLGRTAATGTVQVTDLMVVERYSHVMHLVSNISCDLKEGKTALDLLRATFPAGTLTGAPKIRAMELITELEDSPRGPYGGAVGYISLTGDMDLAITIRTAMIQKGQLRVQAGAGIVADSNPETEYQECINKARAMEKALTLLGGTQQNTEATHDPGH